MFRSRSRPRAEPLVVRKRAIRVAVCALRDAREALDRIGRTLET